MIKYQKGTAGTSFSGFDVLPTSASDTRVLMVYNPRFYASNVALPGSEIAANNTIQKVMDLATVEMRGRAQDLADDIGTLAYGDGRLACAVNKFGDMLETLVRSFVLMPTLA